MSEFTDGILILKEHAPLAQAALADLEPPHIFKDLNEKWSAIFTDNVNMEYNPDDPTRTWALRHSHDFPILYFQHAEDHGWGYRLFYAGEEKASLDVSYEISEGLALELAEQLYPGIDFYDFYGDLSFEKRDALYKQVIESDEYIQQIASQYLNPGIGEFAAFDLSPEDISQLQDILRAEWYEKEFIGLRQVEMFKRILGINEMSWVSYHYLCRDTDEEEDYDE
jgi:hypothetical protein